MTELEDLTFDFSDNEGSDNDDSTIYKKKTRKEIHSYKPKPFKQISWNCDELSHEELRENMTKYMKKYINNAEEYEEQFWELAGTEKEYVYKCYNFIWACKRLEPEYAIEYTFSMYESNLFDECEQNELKEIEKIKNPVKVVEGAYTCVKCKQSKTNSFSKQTRRADEPPTIFIFCMNKDCNHQWREN